MEGDRKREKWQMNNLLLPESRKPTKAGGGRHSQKQFLLVALEDCTDVVENSRCE